MPNKAGLYTAHQHPTSRITRQRRQFTGLIRNISRQLHWSDPYQDQHHLNPGPEPKYIQFIPQPSEIYSNPNTDGLQDNDQQPLYRTVIYTTYQPPLNGYEFNNYYPRLGHTRDIHITTTCYQLNQVHLFQIFTTRVYNMVISGQIYTPVQHWECTYHTKQIDLFIHYIWYESHQHFFRQWFRNQRQICELIDSIDLHTSRGPTEQRSAQPFYSIQTSHRLNTEFLISCDTR
jgi:hypothetical protein